MTLHKPALHSAFHALLSWPLRQAALLFLVYASMTMALIAAETPRIRFDIPAGEARPMLREFARQAKREIVFPTESSDGARTNAVQGEMTPQEALDRMLAGTGLTAAIDRQTGAIAIRKGAADPNGEDRAAAAPAVNEASFHVAQDSAASEGKRTGVVTGRILHGETRQYLRHANVAIAGTRISGMAQEGGVYRLTGIPPGVQTLIVTYEGLDPAEVSVTVRAGQTAIQNVTMVTSGDSGVIQLAEYRVLSEREGSFQAVQEQKNALELKSVAATDAFGDVSEGNIGEFLKLMPGVAIDYVDADAKGISLAGLDPKYVLIMVDGMPVANSGDADIGSGRRFSFEQYSLSGIETVELSKTPTPDMAGSALAGAVNMRSRGAFDRKGRLIRWSAMGAMNSHQMSLQRRPGPADQKTLHVYPNASLEFSDVYFNERLGVLAGVNLSRTFVEQNTLRFTYAFNADPSDNASEMPRLSMLEKTDTPKSTNRASYNLRLDLKVTPALSAWTRLDYNTYSARNFQRFLTFRFANAVNGPGASDPRAANVKYTLLSQTSTTATSEMSFPSTFVKNGASTTWAAGGTYKRAALEVDVQAQLSRATSSYHDLAYGFFNGGSTGQLSGLTLQWRRSAPGDMALDLTQLAGPDWRDVANYTTAPNPSARQPVVAKDQKWKAKVDFRYQPKEGRLPLVVKGGADVALDVRNVDRGSTLNYAYLGPDGRAGTGDERWTIESAYRLRNLDGGNLQDVGMIDRFALARELGAHPERFVFPSADALLRSRLTTHWDVKEQIGSGYLQTIFKPLEKLSFAPGVRFETTSGSGRGPVDRGDAFAREAVTGNPRGVIATTSLDYIQARYGSEVVNKSSYHTWLRYLHATYRFSRDLLLRTSFNDSISRPPLENLARQFVINPDASPPTATVPNPELRPERARNLFLSAEYYFPRAAGFLTASGSRRDISDLIRTSTVDVPVGQSLPNPEDLDLGGYRVSTTQNVAKAHVTSVELSYRQNLVFLPGLWRKLSVFGTFTRLRFDNYESFRRPACLASGGASFDYRALSLRWNVTFAEGYRTAAVPTNGWVSSNMRNRINHDVQVSYRTRAGPTLFLNGRNVFNYSPQVYWSANRPDLIFRHPNYGVVWTAGMRGHF